MRRIALNLATLLVSSAVTLALVEVAFRLTGPWVPKPAEGLYLPGTPGQHRLAAGYRGRVENPEFSVEVRTNSLGLRDREIPPKAPGETRILVLGDSFVFGTGVEEEQTFLRSLERRLEEAPSAPVRVINAGVEGYGTRGAAEMLRRVGPQVRPDVVLLGFYLGNDFADNEEEVRPAGRDPWAASADGWLRSRLESYAWARRRLYVLLAAAGRRSPLLGDFGAMARLAREGAGPEIERAARLVRGLARESESQGAALAVFLIPVRAQVYPAQSGELWRYHRLDPTEDALTAGNRLLTERLEREGIVCFDLLPALRAAAAGSLYFRVDIHWTPPGHEVVAAALEPFLRPMVRARAQPLRAGETAPPRS